jgi:glyoxylase-like metal-dependent hydrolase (beta-lactamase superfamily II)
MAPLSPMAAGHAFVHGDKDAEVSARCRRIHTEGYYLHRSLHYHGDHIANAKDFAGSIWLVQQPERDAMFAEKPPIPQFALYAALKNSKAEILKGQDYDVFGDGRVVIKAAYGHTSGHQVLYLKLSKTGPVLLAGDLYHYREERATHKVPTFEFHKEESSLPERKRQLGFGLNPVTAVGGGCGPLERGPD